METNKHGKNGGSAFFWGLIIGAILATFLTTKKGRQILRDLTGAALELFEEFIEEKKAKHTQKVREQDIEEAEATEDIESEIADVEETSQEAVEKVTVEQEQTPVKNGHSEKRLFRGIRRK